jgi:hypothetical protein
MNDAEGFEYYDNPANREPAPGPPRRRPERPLTQHVPVRLPRETVRRAKRLADADGVTVSTWVRRAVDEALQRRDSIRRERPSRRHD